MANHQIYGCKSKSRPFRLPAIGYQEAVNTVNACLKLFRVDLSKGEAKEAELVLKRAIKRLKEIRS